MSAFTETYNKLYPPPLVRDVYGIKWSPRPMVVGDIYPCHTLQMKRQDDFRKVWMWYAAQSDRKVK